MFSSKHALQTVSLPPSFITKYANTNTEFVKGLKFNNHMVKWIYETLEKMILGTKTKSLICHFIVISELRIQCKHSKQQQKKKINKASEPKFKFFFTFFSFF